ncbi:MAG: hypothetical protein FJY83_09575 [Candidatus Aminicenantes bacterium]|nr:hypothetical protein [Candidatus Aminicenantes bacterium]
MKKIDLRKKYKDLYTASAKKPALLDVPSLPYLMIDGAGDPNTAKSFQRAVGTLYSISYTLKFAWKKEKAVDYPVMALEGLWWMNDMSAFSLERKNEWKWTMMIMQPDFVPRAEALKIARRVREKSGLEDFPAVRYEIFKEGRCAQVLHVGPYSAEGPTVARLHEFIRSEGYALRGKHHEIYLGDPRRAAPDRLRTIIRQPVG